MLPYAQRKQHRNEAPGTNYEVVFALVMCNSGDISRYKISYHDIKSIIKYNST